MKPRTLQESKTLFDALIMYGIDKAFIDRYMNWEEDPNWTETGNFLGIADLVIDSIESMQYNITTKIINYKFQ